MLKRKDNDHFKKKWAWVIFFCKTLLKASYLSFFLVFPSLHVAMIFPLTPLFNIDLLRLWKKFA